MKQLTTEQTAEFLLKRDRFLLLTHKNPDGDTLGSAAALCNALRELGKTAYLLRNTQTTDMYLADVTEYFTDYSALDGEFTLISVDTADINLMQVNEEIKDAAIALAIDHHPSHNQFAENLLLIADKASCGEIILETLNAMQYRLSPETAKLLYIAVSTDTGCFRYKNTKAETLLAAAELVSAGAPSGNLNQRLFMSKRLSRLKLESMIVGGLEMYMDGELSIAVITQAMMKEAGADSYDLEDIATVAGQPEGVEMGVTIREKSDGTCKLSVRTTNYANANAACAYLGGGGHGMASGANVDLGIDDARAKILEAIKNVWKGDEYKL
ncbi:MAG: DHH family phosphoesterase [Oscillospiraceae bacterium]|jgi:phosphoesterase RecJ-like protein|nr:DHH family phosphoesterase [Oscillospiraceae bacterium]